MANIFAQQNTVNNTPKRNNFDLSFQNHMTMKFGTLYPFMCKEVVPGDSFRIESALGLQFMPLAFPVQSRMRAHMHFFYVRNKNLWKNWQNWISNLADRSAHPHPYVLPDAEDAVNGSIYDYLNLPTSITSEDFPVSSTFIQFNRNAVDPVIATFRPSDSSLMKAGSFETNGYVVFQVPAGLISYSFRFKFSNEVIRSDSHAYLYFGLDDDSAFYDGGTPPFNVEFPNSRIDLGSYTFDSNTGLVTFSDLPDLSNLPTDKPLFVAFRSAELSSASPWFRGNVFMNVGTISLSEAASLTGVNTSLNNPFDDLMPSALPLRAYESIYNAFYRNTVNQPFIKNGEPVYNEYITNDGDGYDNTHYHLFQRNYEMDFLTSCLPSPQQGKAPLVGMSALGEISIEDDHGLTTAKAKLADDGNTIVGVEVTSPIADIDHARLLMNMAASGMSINDFRQTNALQHWLETNIRKGYKYVDFISGHFGKSPEYRELDMPEFIGGFSRDVNVSTIVSQADTYGISGSDGGAELGSFVGRASLFAGGNHAITHYCDDYGFIMGIVCVVPDPAYSQLLPKMYLKRNPLDYYFPEFAQIGMQPVTYAEVAPLQTIVDRFTDDSKQLSDTFGYQRPYYDLVSSVNEVHGGFRGNLRDFLINRRFDTRPELGNKFLIIDPDEVNDIFINQDPDDDTIIGQIVLKISAKRPVPRVHIPSLGK